MKSLLSTTQQIRVSIRWKR